MGGSSSRESPSFHSASDSWGGPQSPYGRSNSQSPYVQQYPQSPYGRSDSQSPYGQQYPQSPYGRSDSQSPYGQQYPQPPYSQESQSYAPEQSQSTQDFHGGAVNKRRMDRRYSRIADNYQSLDEVTEALARAGLESSNLILGIDFTKSNEWTGAKSYNKRSLHHIGDGQNPYEQAISIIGKTLAAFDEDNLIPCFGFGDASTHDQDVFSFHPNDKVCHGFEEVLSRYRAIVPQLRLAGPTSFAPIIEMAITIVEQSGGQYHVLVIIADGQVTRSVDTERGRLSPQEQKTVDAIVEASKFPLSIILVGVGDGPWDMMKEFDDNIPAREFDNFQFVNFTEIMSKNTSTLRKETEFALSALMEVPSQYKATIEHHLLGRRQGNVSQRIPLPPPVSAVSLLGSFSSPKAYGSAKPYEMSVEPTVPPYPWGNSATDTPSPASSTYDDQLCAICLTNSKDLAFGCGHQTCCECGQDLDICPICRSTIHTRIKLY